MRAALRKAIVRAALRRAIVRAALRRAIVGAALTTRWGECSESAQYKHSAWSRFEVNFSTKNKRVWGRAMRVWGRALHIWGRGVLVTGRVSKRHFE